MPAPGSSHALVLPTASSTGEDPAEAGARLTPQLELFLDDTKYSAVAVVHGLSDSASNAFDLAKERRPAKAGVVWVTDPEFLQHLVGSRATKLRRLLARPEARVMSFFSVGGGRVTGDLHFRQLWADHVDAKYADAALNQRS